MAILIGEETGWADVENVARKAAGDALTDLRVFDVYQGEHIEKGQKSVALSLYWQHPERTLGDEEVQGLFDTVTRALQNELGAQLRS